MSMPGTAPQGRGEVGEKVAEFTRYESAQKAVSTLIAGEIPAREIAIVGRGLRSIERVTGKLGYATAARSGAVNGLLLGLLFAAFFVLGDSSVQVSVFVGVLFVGIALGMLLSLGAYAIVRRRKDFASVMQVVADEYDVTVLPQSIHRAREILGSSEHAGAMSGAHPAPATPPAPPPAATHREPPRYGERIEQPERPRYGEMRPVVADTASSPDEESAAPESASAPDAHSVTDGDAPSAQGPGSGGEIAAEDGTRDVAADAADAAGDEDTSEPDADTTPETDGDPAERGDEPR